MNWSTKLLSLCTLLLLGSAACADFLEEGGMYGPRCRNLRTFPYVSCEPQCAPYSWSVHHKCQAKHQFGCQYTTCATHQFQCALTPDAASTNDCPDGEVQVRDVTLRPGFPVEFDLAVNLKGVDLDVVLLIDASESTRPRLNAVKSELSSFVRQLSGVAHVGVAVYGGEDSFDDKGMQILSPAQEDVQQAVNALENLPTFPDGPRTSLTALYSVQTAGQAISLRGWRTIIVLIGDTPGREPDCSPFQFDRNTLPGSLFEFSYGTSVMPVSLGGVGLDGTLPPIAACANGYGPTEPQAVAAGQASKIAEDTNGEVVSSITASALLEGVDRVRRKPHRSFKSAPGSTISISTASVVPVNAPYYPSTERINGCEDKVIVTMSGIPSFVSEPAQITGTVKLDVPWAACQSGPFSCTIRVLDHAGGQEAMSHWARSVTYYKKISVRAC